MRVLLAMLLMVWLFASGSVHAQVGRGVGTERASAADVTQLARDLGRLSNAERAFRQLGQDVLTEQQLDRQRLLLGADARLSPQEVASLMKAWWIEHLLQPALDIAANPAASCSAAQSLLRRILDLARQAQTLGVEGMEFGSLGDTDSIIAGAIRIAKERCLVEAYDECLETGNGQAFFDILKSFSYAPLESENDAQIEYLFRRCTVYALVYRLELSSVWTKDTATEQVSGFIEGSYTLLHASKEAGDSLTRLGFGEWRGPPELQLFSNAQLSRMSCGPNCVTVITDSPIDETAHGIISMKRVVREMRPRVAYETAEDQARGGRLVWEMREEETGRNAIVLRFEPPQFHTMAQHRTATLEYDTGGVDSEIFYMATGRAAEPLLIEDWAPAAHPVLFTALMFPRRTVTDRRGGNYQANLRGSFKLVHRPDLYPPEEIVPALELQRREPERPPRIPLQSSRNPPTR